MPSFSDPRAVCRPALPSDTADVLAFTSRIWEGTDYIHLVWDDWLAEHTGLLASAQFGSQVVGIGKLTPVFPGQWWLHGLRVNPDYQGMKIGSHMHEYLNDWWVEHGDGMLRLFTNTERVQVQHLCERTGYSRIGEFITYRRLLDSNKVRVVPGVEAISEGFRPVAPAELPEALDFANRHLPYMGGLMDMGWRFVLPDPAVLAERAASGHLRWWRGREGLLATWEGDDDIGPVLGIGFAAVHKSGALQQMLSDAVGLSAGLDVKAVCWLAPAAEEVQAALVGAGYASDNESDVLYARKHPDR